MMCSQLLEGLKCESQTKNSGKARSQEHAPWFVALWRGRGACQNSGMRLGIIDKLHLLTWACTNPTQGGQCIVGTHLVLGRAMGNSNSQDSPQPRLGRNHHLPPYSILYVFPRSPHPNGILSRDSQVRMKLPKLGLPQLWGPITSHTHVQLK